MRALCPPQKYICALLEGEKTGDALKRAVKRRHSKYSIFLLKGPWPQWARASPRRGPWGPWAHSRELGGNLVRACVSLLCWGEKFTLGGLK